MAKKINKGTLIFLAILISVVMYLAGVFSGLYTNKILQVRVQEDIGKVEKDVDLLKNYTDSSALDLKNMQLLQLYMNNLDDNCKFSNLYMENLYSQLKPYWDRLPSRLEEYEKGRTSFSEDYLSLKREYIRLQLRIWLIMNHNVNKCNNTEFIPVLYFYSKDCEFCIRQGEYFDAFKERMLKEEKTVLVFPIDTDFYDDTSYLLKKYYNISSVPAIIINGKINQGRYMTDGMLRLALS